jgi:SAM-dependent methyltransferase
MATYTYDQAWEAERERLAGIERLWDEGTFALLERLGVGPGSAVAEVGAGGGSVVEWLADRVGPGGRVLATDLYPKHFEHLARGPVEVRQHDITAEPLPAGEFDLVHARLLVEHIGFGALPTMCAGLRPGGVLLLEDYDMTCRGFDPEHPDADRAVEAVVGLMVSFGFDHACGRKLPRALEAAGLVDVTAEGRVRVVRSGTPETAFFRLSVASVRQQLVASGRVADAEVDAALQAMEEPGRTLLSPLMVACWGRRAL